MIDLLAFSFILAVMFGVAKYAHPKSRIRARSQLEAARRLDENDVGFIEADALRQSVVIGCVGGLAPCGLLALTRIYKLSDAVLLFFLLAVPTVLLFAGAGAAYILAKYGREVRIEIKRRAGGGLAGLGRYGNNVHRSHNVENLRGEVIEKLTKTNQRGPLVLLNPSDNEAALKVELERRKAKPWDLHGWRSSDEDRLFVVGSPGSGKTTFLIAQLIDWMNSGRSFVATDIKPEIWSILTENGIFERFGYTDYVINPTSPHAHRFNLFAEIENDADLNEVLSVIIPPGEGEGAVFADNARRLLKAVLSHLAERASLPAARDFIMAAGKISELLELLSDSPKKSVQRIAFEIKNTAGNERLMASIMTAMSKAFEFMDDERIEAAISTSDFSMCEVLAKPRQAVFLQFEQKYKSSLATLFGGTVAYVLRQLQSSAPTREYSVFVALDEIMNAAPIPRFAETLNTMRSAKMPLGMYLQSTEGLNRVYGPGAAELFMGASDARVVFKVGDNATAEYISVQLGDTEQRTISASSSQTSATNDSGATFGNSYSQGYSSTTARVLDPAEILGLEPGKAIVIYRGSGARFSMPRYDKDYPASLRASIDPRPQSEFVSR